MSRSICPSIGVDRVERGLGRCRRSDDVPCRGELQTERGELLAKMIVQITGNPTALLLLRDDQTPEQLEPRLLRGPPFRGFHLQGRIGLRQLSTLLVGLRLKAVVRREEIVAGCLERPNEAHLAHNR